mgnify:CR=1 FL=1
MKLKFSKELLNYNNYQNFILAFLYLSGFLSAFLNKIISGFDLVLIALIFATVDIIFNLISRKVTYNKNSIHLLFIILIFYTWMIFTLTYSPSFEYKYEKTGNFLVSILLFLYPLFIRKVNFNFIIKLYTIIMVPFAVFLVYMKSITYSVERESVELFIGYWLDYLSLGFHLGILVLLLNYFNKNIFLQILTLALLFASSARGPLIFTILILILMNFKKNKRIIFKSFLRYKKTFFLLIVLIFINLNNFASLFQKSIGRFMSLGSGYDESVASRIAMMKYAFYQPFENMSNFLFGNGIGSFGIYYNGVDARGYPHNVILEIFFELGLLGVIIFFVLMVFIMKRFSVRNNVFSILFFFAFLNAMKSSNLTSLWIFFSFIAGMSLNNKIIKVNDYNN